MKVHDFMDMMACLREETEKYCRGHKLPRRELENLGWWLVSKKYLRPNTNFCLEMLIVKFVIQYGERG